MANHIHVRGELADGYLTPDEAGDGPVVWGSSVREALSDLDVSASSPVSAHGREIGRAVMDGEVTLRVEGHAGEVSQQTQVAIVSALEAVEGVTSVEVVSGGYDEPDEDDEGGEAADGDEDDEAAEPVESITGVGGARANTLREAGIETVDDVIDAGADGLVAAGLPEGVAENVVENAG